MANVGRGKTTPPRVRPRGDIGHRAQKRRAAPDVEGEERPRLGERHQLGELHRLRRRPHDVGSEWLFGELSYRPRSFCGAFLIPVRAGPFPETASTATPSGPQTRPPLPSRGREFLSAGAKGRPGRTISASRRVRCPRSAVRGGSVASTSSAGDGT